MGIALLALSTLVEGLTRLGRPAATVHTDAPASLPRRVLHFARPAVERPPVRVRPLTSIRAPSTLRVVHVPESEAPSSGMGRLVICGRMADVCAELDRLVACEQQRVHPWRKPTD